MKSISAGKISIVVSITRSYEYRMINSKFLVGVSQIPKSDAVKLVNTTLPRPGSDDYLIELDVFHQLHCLNDLRKAFYPDRYPGKWPYLDGKVDYKSITFMHWGKYRGFQIKLNANHFLTYRSLHRRS